MSFLSGHPPKVIWVRLGNCTTAQVLQCLADNRPRIQAFEIDETGSFLIVVSGLA